VSSLSAWLLLASLVPQVEDPLPDRIGLGFPFAMATAGGVLAGIIYADAPGNRRNKAIKSGGRFGFLAGAVVYLLALVVQVSYRR
jgi:hypothetical protein